MMEEELTPENLRGAVKRLKHRVNGKVAEAPCTFYSLIYTRSYISCVGCKFHRDTDINYLCSYYKYGKGLS